MLCKCKKSLLGILLGRWDEKLPWKIANKALSALFGQTGQIQHLQIVFRDESQMALLLRRLGQETRDKAVTRGL
jgi:hypothetical protein